MYNVYITYFQSKQGLLLRYTSKGGRNIFVPYSVCECEAKSLMGWFRGCQVQGIDWGCKRWQSCPPFRRRGNLWRKNCVIPAITKNVSNSVGKNYCSQPDAFLPTLIAIFILIILVIIIKSSSTNTNTPTHSMWQKAEQVQLVVLLSYSGWLCYWLCPYVFLCVVVCAVGRLRVSRCPQSRSWWRDSFWAPLLYPAYEVLVLFRECFFCNRNLNKLVLIVSCAKRGFRLHWQVRFQALMWLPTKFYCELFPQFLVRSGSQDQGGGVLTADLHGSYQRAAVLICWPIPQTWIKTLWIGWNAKMIERDVLYKNFAVAIRGL